jgi:hypothetical protein
MERELGELDRQPVSRFESLDTPGDEIAPGSNKVRKNFENQRFRHDRLLVGTPNAYSRFYVSSSAEVKGCGRKFASSTVLKRSRNSAIFLP